MAPAKAAIVRRAVEHGIENRGQPRLANRIIVGGQELGKGSVGRRDPKVRVHRPLDEADRAPRPEVAEEDLVLPRAFRGPREK